MLGSLVQGRVCISGASISAAKSALTIAVRGTSGSTIDTPAPNTFDHPALSAIVSLAYGVSISQVFVRERDWLHEDTPFLVNAREDAIAG